MKKIISFLIIIHCFSFNGKAQSFEAFGGVTKVLFHTGSSSPYYHSEASASLGYTLGFAIDSLTTNVFPLRIEFSGELLTAEYKMTEYFKDIMPAISADAKGTYLTGTFTLIPISIRKEKFQMHFGVGAGYHLLSNGKNSNGESMSFGMFNLGFMSSIQWFIPISNQLVLTPRLKYQYNFGELVSEVNGISASRLQLQVGVMF